MEIVIYIGIVVVDYISVLVWEFIFYCVIDKLSGFINSSLIVLMISLFNCFKVVKWMKRWFVEFEKIYLLFEVLLGVGFDGIVILLMGIFLGFKGEVLFLFKEIMVFFVNLCNLSIFKMEINKWIF